MNSESFCLESRVLLSRSFTSSLVWSGSPGLLRCLLLACPSLRLLSLFHHFFPGSRISPGGRVAPSHSQRLQKPSPDTRLCWRRNSPAKVRREDNLKRQEELAAPILGMKACSIHSPTVAGEGSQPACRELGISGCSLRSSRLLGATRDTWVEHLCRAVPTDRNRCPCSLQDEPTLVKAGLQIHCEPEGWDQIYSREQHWGTPLPLRPPVTLN